MIGTVYAPMYIYIYVCVSVSICHSENFLRIFLSAARKTKLKPKSHYEQIKAQQNVNHGILKLIRMLYLAYVKKNITSCLAWTYFEVHVVLTVVALKWRCLLVELQLVINAKASYSIQWLFEFIYCQL